ncbi:3-hydroxyisobutyryl-CoA hydrolase isoform X1 [Leptinotarsa decemlineata]|uniref:3-hydroxyisobutyryl-CoA hydrolase isoform X1 n=1 Tax=Leptinotarsa decemlineata TaxID=7539 RepID=UPI003D30B19C
MFQMTTTFALSHSKNSRLVVASLIRRMSSAQDDVIFQDVGDKGVIILNRPKALNALNLSMIKKIGPKMRDWESEKKLVLVKGTGGKAFCAGGDVRAVIESHQRGETSWRDFFKLEYANNARIGSYKIPYIALIDGIVMGGGVGLSVHGHYRVATERTLFAMPETQIGFFPDVGGSYFLPRMKGKLGWYLALTGQRLRGSDVLRAGIATHFCESKHLDDLEQALLTCSNRGDIDTVLSNFEQKEVPPFSLEPVLAKIDKCFSAPSMEGIVSNLKKDGSSWAEETLKILDKMSPTSLKVTLRQLEEGSKINLDDCLDLEYTICVNFVKNKDFAEGVRALLIDKDQNPKWDPPAITKVSDDFVNSHFEKEQDVFKNRL